MNLDDFRQSIKDQLEAFKYNYSGKVAKTAYEKAHFESLVKKGLIHKNRSDFFKILFAFGKATSIIGDTKVKMWTKFNVIKFLETEIGKLSNIEEQSLNFIKAEAEDRLSSLFDNIGAEINGKFRNRILGGPEFNRQVGEALGRRITNRQTTRAMASDIGRTTKQWSRDLYRIAFSESETTYNLGTAFGYMKNTGKKPGDILVAKIPKGEGISCNECMKFYWDKAKDQPRIFKLSEIMGASNVGQKRKDWKPTLMCLHPFCSCRVVYIYPEQIWNKQFRRFEYRKVK